MRAASRSKRDREARGRAARCSLFIGVFTPWPTRTSEGGVVPRGRQGLRPRRGTLALGRGRPVGAARAHRRLPRRDRAARSSGTTASTRTAPQLRRHAHKGIPVTTPGTDGDPPLLTGRLQDAAPRGQSGAQPAGCSSLRDLITHNHRGAKNLRAVLATAAPTRSENENAVLHLLHDAGIPKPLVNPAIAGTNLIPDFLWPDNALILETDSGATTTTCSPAPTTAPSRRSSKPSATPSSAPPGPRSRPGRTG